MPLRVCGLLTPFATLRIARALNRLDNGLCAVCLQNLSGHDPGLSPRSSGIPPRRPATLGRSRFRCVLRTRNRITIEQAQRVRQTYEQNGDVT